MASDGRCIAKYMVRTFGTEYYNEFATYPQPGLVVSATSPRELENGGQYPEISSEGGSCSC